MAPTATGKKVDALFTRRSSRPKASSAATTSARGATGASSSAFTFAALFARVALSSDARRAASASESRQDEHARAGGVQAPRDRRADAARAAGDEHRPSLPGNRP